MALTPVVVGTPGVMSKNLQDYLQKIRVNVRTALLQKVELLGSDRILRKILEV